MNIDRSNIEAWLLDRAEGCLTAEQERALDAFLLLNPDLQPDNDDLPVLRVGPIAPVDKGSLKRFLPPTGAIDARNIDDHLIARQEGDLSAEQLQALDNYLAAHPDLARTARLYAITQVKRSAVSFPDKAGLSRTLPPQGLPDHARLDDFLVARMEGDLTLQQRTALDDLLKKDATAAKAWGVLSRARVEATEVVFPHKAELKKKEVKVLPLWSRTAVRYAAAASVALLLGLAWWLLREGPVGKPEMAVEKETPAQNSPAAQQGENEKGTTPDVQPGTKPENSSGGTNNPSPAPLNSPEVNDQKNDAGTQPEPAAPAIQRMPSERVERVNPLLAESKDPATQPIGGVAPQVPISKDAPEMATAPSHSTEAMTIGELFASTVRKEVLDDPAPPSHKLDGDDAVALVDKGLNALGGKQAGLDVEHESGRRRFNLRLGRDLAITASAGR